MEIRISLDDVAQRLERLGHPDAVNAARALVDYSGGRKPRSATMRAIGIQDYGVLLDLLSATGLPRPSLPQAEIERMAENFASVIRKSRKP